MISVDNTHDAIEKYIKTILSEVAGISANQISSLDPFKDLGIDSFYVLKILKRFEEDFGVLPKTLLFEYFNVGELAEYFVSQHMDSVATLFGENSFQASDSVVKVNLPIVSEATTKPKQPLAAPKPSGAATPKEKYSVQTRVTPIASQIKGSSTPILITEKDLDKYDHIAQRAKALMLTYSNEGSVSRGTRVIAPNLFISSAADGMVHYARYQSIFLAYAYTGNSDHYETILQEIHDHCHEHDLELSALVDFPIGNVGKHAYSATPFGAMQRVFNLKEFSLSGSKMRRLRYLVNKFSQSGQSRTEEFKVGSDDDTSSQIAEIIDRWSSERAMVNPLIETTKASILNGDLPEEHRLFLTYYNDQLQNVILITAMCEKQNGYLMDLEFYPKNMPLGGLEFGIVNIIATLVEEGCDQLSLGATLGPKLADDGQADPALDKLLDSLREQGIFNDAGNLQFKNKFRPENKSILLCREVGRSDPQTVVDIIMMIADPTKMGTIDPMLKDLGKPVEVTERRTPARPSEPPEQTSDDEPSSELYPEYVNDVLERQKLLEAKNFNTFKLTCDQVEFDLKTDSWQQLQGAFIDNRLEKLNASIQDRVELSPTLEELLTFDKVLLTQDGKSAESVLYAAWPQAGVVPQNLLFPTAIFHQINQRFNPQELPDYDSSNTIFRGGIDIEALRNYISSNDEKPAFVSLELASNATGGLPTSLAQVEALKTLLDEQGILLHMDMTRVLDNSLAIIEHETIGNNKNIWEVTRALLQHADLISGSLTKNFGVLRGGMLAVRDAKLFALLEAEAEKQNRNLNVLDRKRLAVSLLDREGIEALVSLRVKNAHTLGSRLLASGLSVIQPVGGHCVLLDLKALRPFSDMECNDASFLSSLYIHTGIRASAHSCGMQQDGIYNQCVRLAIPLGLTPASIDEIANRLQYFFKSWRHLVEVELSKPVQEIGGEISADYRLVNIHQPISHTVKQEESELPELELPESELDDSASVNQSNQINNFNKQAPAQGLPNIRPENTNQKATASSDNIQEQIHPKTKPMDIAIVGIAGRYPKSRTMAEFWQNLSQGIDCITEISEERLARRETTPNNEKYRGGFIDDVERFDSLFFNISPREAELLDPQERQFLEVAWETLENAGYFPERLAQKERGLKVGVFVGAVWTMYQMQGLEQKFFGQQMSPNSFMWGIANRVSYCMNFTGPSITLDTACSSSLSAVHLACEAILRGDCTSAIAGGVNLDLHQCKQDINHSLGALSQDGFCKSFGQGADGYVPGEGVGALYLKTLSQAEADGDNIWGVIKGTAVNHGGRTSGYTVPNPKSQSELICDALERSGVDARTVGYIEAHGTGTELGDPIEINGLNRAYSQYEVKPKTCAIGSVKSNIGHLEAAAGIVGIHKTLLQMQHAQIVPSLHCQNLNEHIDFESTPFVVAQKARKWKAKKVDGEKFPLRAGVSSFGAGGANAHLILEQYQQQISESSFQCHIYPLSARNDAQLKSVAARLLAHIRQCAQRTGGSFNDIAYTLQVGRKVFDHRAAIVAQDFEQLIQGLEAIVTGVEHPTVVSGHISGGESLTQLLENEERRAFLELLRKSSDHRKLAKHWVEGLVEVIPSSEGRIIPLPSYPFADRRHWIATNSDRAIVQNTLHPFVDANISTFDSIRFVKSFSRDEFFLYDHHVSDIPTLPGVAYLELARKTGELAAGRRVAKIKNILWLHPLALENSGNVNAQVELVMQGEEAQFRVCDHPAGETVFAQGKLTFASDDIQDEYLDIEQVRSRCELMAKGQESYPKFAELGLGLGESFQVLQSVYGNSDEVLGELVLPSIRSRDSDAILLHPSLVDGALQAVMAAELSKNTQEMFVPYSLGCVEIRHPITQRCYSYVTRADDKGRASSVSKANISIVDEKGKVLVKIIESIGVPIGDVHGSNEQRTHQVAQVSQPTDENPEKLHYYREWVNESLLDTEPLARRALVFENDDERFHAITTHGDCIRVEEGEKWARPNTHHFIIAEGNHDDLAKVIQCLANEKFSFDCVMWCGNFWQGLREYESISGVLSLTKALNNNVPKQRISIAYYYFKGELLTLAQDASVAFFKTQVLEHPKLPARTIAFSETIASSQWVKHLWQECAHAQKDAQSIRYLSDGRQRLSYKKHSAIEVNSASLRQGGCYLITGGAGGLGEIFARYLAERYQAKIVLMGRSALDEKKSAMVEAINELGGKALYVSGDVSRYDDVASALSLCQETFGDLHGIFHAAGVLKDAFMRDKTVTAMNEVLDVKIAGAKHLDELSQHIDLDVFVLFSSLAAIGGNAGQCDYAFANHYLDVFALEREQQRLSGQRSGKTLSINWSLWADGGMGLDPETERFFTHNLGIYPLQTADALALFEGALVSEESSLALLEANSAKLERYWGLNKATTDTSDDGAVKSERVQSVTDDTLIEKVTESLSNIVMTYLKLEADDIDREAVLLDLGFDSIGLTNFANEINDTFKIEITPVLFFEFPSINTVASHLADEFYDQVASLYGGANVDQKSTSTTKMDQPARRDAFVAPPKALNITPVKSSGNRFQDRPIAIVGMSGVMSEADDLNEFWQRLSAGENMITEVPRSRWKWQDYFGDPILEENKSNSKWGGFMREIDKFDPLFFGISPREAEWMDPQQRLFLQCVWSALEDSGHRVSDFSGTRTGVFVGVATNDYADLINSKDLALDGYTASGNSHSVLANRVSFLLNLRGPSAPIDTACSSSLIAIHRAIESIHTGSCEMAVAGGVHVMMTPAAYVSFGMAGMLADDGKCKTFDERADGYVRGEGVGAVLLKPLDKALEDNDHIYAVVRATAENHGGKVTSLTAPNPNAQAELLVEAYTKAQINPSAVGMIECHGTGTSLGDPIEVQALKKAFKSLHQNQYSNNGNPHCGLTSVKTNIGHLETAAGIAGVMKSLLALKHKKIPGLANFESANPYINLDKSPFYLVNKTTDWQSPQTDDGNTLLRCSGVSSFGFGGANAHIVLEEWPQEDNGPISDEQHIVVLSAKDSGRLDDYVRSMQKILHGELVSLRDVAYTLMEGRDAMSHRFVAVVDSIAQLHACFEAYLNRSEHPSMSYTGSDVKLSSEDIGDVVLFELADRWMQGDIIAWNKTTPGKRISLPTYPFAKERHWFQADASFCPREQSPVLHPLLNENISDLSCQAFATVLTENAPGIIETKDVGRVLSPVAALDLLTTALTQSVPPSVRTTPQSQLHNVLFLNPIVLNQAPLNLRTEVKTLDRGHFVIEVKEADRLCIRAESKRSLEPMPLIDKKELEILLEEKSIDNRKVSALWSTLNLDPQNPVASVWQRDDWVVASLKKYDEPIAGFSGCLNGTILMLMGMLVHKTAQVPSCRDLPYALTSLTQGVMENPPSYLMVARYEDSGRIAFDIQGLDDNCSVLFSLNGVEQERRDNCWQEQLSETSKRWLPINEFWSHHALDKNPDAWLDKVNSKRDASILLISNGEKHFSTLNQLVLQFKQVVGGLHWQCQHLDWGSQDASSWQSLEQCNFDVVFIVCEHEEAQGSIEQIYTSIQHLHRYIPQIPLQVFSTSSVPDNGQEVMLHAVSGLYKSAMLEVPDHQLQNIVFAEAMPEDVVLRLVNEWLCGQQTLTSATAPMVKYIGEDRFSLQVQESMEYTPSAEPISFRTGACYLMIGAMGEVGLDLCETLGKHFAAHLVILSRRSTEGLREQMEKIRQSGARVDYHSVDILDQDALASTMRTLWTDGIRFNGVFHLARQVKDATIADKSFEEFSQTIAAKVQGTANVHEVTREHPLEFFLMFSSVAAFGIKGSPDYAFATAYQNHFARFRNTEVEAKRAFGKTLSLCWGQWEKDGGVDSTEMAQRLKIMKTMGMDVVDVPSAMIAMEVVLNNKSDVIGVVAVHEREQVAKILGLAVTRNEKSEDVNTLLSTFESGTLTPDEFAEALENLDVDSLSPEQQETIVALIQKIDNSGGRYLESSTLNMPSRNFIPPIQIQESEKLLARSKSLDLTEEDSVESADNTIAADIMQCMEEVLKIKREMLVLDKPFMDYGMDSISAVQITTALEKVFGCEIAPNWLIDHPNIESLAKKIESVVSGAVA